MKITADTNFLISATQWDYSVAHKLLKNFILSDAEIFTTQGILGETIEVLKEILNIVKMRLKILLKRYCFLQSL